LIVYHNPYASVSPYSDVHRALWRTVLCHRRQ